MEPAVFLDRDNTLIANDGDLGDPRLVHVHDDVPAGLRALREAGYRLVVVTNQAGVARGRFTEAEVDAVHQRIAQLVDESAEKKGLIDRFYYCPYHPEGSVREYCRDHPWRKPHPGMILQAARDMGLDLAGSWMIGDQARDISAGQAAGCRTVLIARNGEGDAALKPTATVRTFADAVQTILRDAEMKRGSRGEPAQRPQPASGGAPASTPAHTSAEPQPSPSAASETTGLGDLEPLRRAMLDLTEELRADRMRRSEFTSLRMIGIVCQLLVLLLALLGLLQLDDLNVFFKWMMAAALLQLLTIALFVLDLKS